LSGKEFPFSTVGSALPTKKGKPKKKKRKRNKGKKLIIKNYVKITNKNKHKN
jgi:hypothetical protein